MTTALSLLCRVVRRRLEKGEELESVLKDYPKLTAEELEEVQAAVAESRPASGGEPT